MWSRLFMRLGNFDVENVICTPNGWLNEQDQQFFNNGIRALEKPRTKVVYFIENYVES